MRRNIIICTILFAVILSFLPIQAQSPDVTSVDSTIPQCNFQSRYEGDFNVAHIVTATYHSCWDSGIDIESNCKVDMRTKEVFDIEIVNVDGFDLEILEDEFVEIDGIPFAVFPRSELGDDSNSFWRND